MNMRHIMPLKNLKLKNADLVFDLSALQKTHHFDKQQIPASHSD
jgi:hypothetical protein